LIPSLLAPSSSPGYNYDTEYCYWEIVHNVDRVTAEAVLANYAGSTGDIRGMNCQHGAWRMLRVNYSIVSCAAHKRVLGLYLVRHSSKVAGAIVVSMFDKSKLFHYQFLPTPTGKAASGRYRS
jgi:hypothetical protein